MLFLPIYSYTNIIIFACPDRQSILSSVQVFHVSEAATFWGGMPELLLVFKDILDKISFGYLCQIINNNYSINF